MQKIIASIALTAFAAISGNSYAGSKCIPDNFQANIQPAPSDDWADAQRLHLMQELRSADRIKNIQEENHDPTPKFWIAAGLQAKSHPDLEREITKIQKIAEKITLELKAKHARARPSLADDSLTTVVPVPWHASYPSGHATQSMLTALALSAAVPGAKDQLKALAIDVAHGREIAGLHYASDTQAGFELAQQIWRAIDNDCKPEALPQYHHTPEAK